jgi:hypothetical protein
VPLTVACSRFVVGSRLYVIWVTAPAATDPAVAATALTAATRALVSGA